MVNRQIMTAIFCQLGGFHIGAFLGWLSPALPYILSDEKPLGDVTLQQTSWLAASHPTSAIAAPLILHWSKRFGCRKCIIVSTVLFAINGTIALLARDVRLLMVGRFIAGFSTIMYFCNGSAFVAHISDPGIRGRLASLYNLLFQGGLLVSYVFGGLVSYTASSVVLIVVAVVNFFLLLLIPDAPIYLIQMKRSEAATKAIAWYKNVPIDSLDVKEERIKLEMANSSEEQLTILQALKVLFTSKPMRYGFLICVVIFVCQVYSGMFAVQAYAVIIFMEGGSSNLTPQQAAVVIASIQVVGAISATMFIDNLGRKVLLLVSFAGISLTMLSMALYFDFKNQKFDMSEYQWVPVASLCICVFAYTIGVGGIPFILVADLLLKEVKVVASMMAMQVTCVNAFLMYLFFEPISVHYGRHVTFYFFSVVCVAAILFVIFFVDETKGKQNEDIVDINYRFKAKLKITESNKSIVSTAKE